MLVRDGKRSRGVRGDHRRRSHARSGPPRDGGRRSVGRHRRHRRLRAAPRRQARPLHDPRAPRRRRHGRRLRRVRSAARSQGRAQAAAAGVAARRAAPRGSCARRRRWRGSRTRTSSPCYDVGHGAATRSSSRWSSSTAATLRAWLAARRAPWREILALFAARGPRPRGRARAPGSCTATSSRTTCWSATTAASRVTDFGLARAADDARSRRSSADTGADDAEPASARR